MVFQRIVAFGITIQIACTSASEYNLGSTSWAEPSRTKWCPVHAPFSISNTGSGVILAPPLRGAFSLAETSATLPTNHGTAGLRLKLSASGSKMVSFWRIALRLSTGGDKVRFIAPVEVPSGGIEKNVFLPWTSFEGQKMRAGGVDICDDRSGAICTLDPEKLTHISIIWARKEGIEEPTLSLSEMVATSSTTVEPQGFSDTLCGCDADCVQCMASDWAVLVSNSCSSSSTWDMCLAVRRSLAERIASSLSGSCNLPGATDAVQWLSSALDVSQCAKSSPSLPAVVLGDVLHGVLTVALAGTCQNGKVGMSVDFVGPFVGWGITGHNDLSNFDSETADSCLAKCRSNMNCKSVDYGARDSVRGQCWLSTKDRFTESGSFSNGWVTYDYYELAGTSLESEAAYAGTMANGLSTDARAELLQGLPDEFQCCGDPDNCIKKAIEAGAPAYNSGDTLGCFVIYHATADRLAKCSIDGQGLPDGRGLMRATAKTAEMETHTGQAAWRLRHAFDLYVSMLSSDSGSWQCEQRFTPTLMMNNVNIYTPRNSSDVVASSATTTESFADAASVATSASVFPFRDMNNLLVILSLIVLFV